MPDPGKPFLGAVSAIADLLEATANKSFPTHPSAGGARSLPDFLNPTPQQRFIDPIGALSAITDIADPPKRAAATLSAAIPAMAALFKKRTLPSRVVRHQSMPIRFDKPQGLYTTPVEFRSPHAAEGPAKEFVVNQDANVLHVDASEFIPSPRNRGGPAGQSAGLAALRVMIGQEQTHKLLFTPKRELSALLAKEVPDADWSRYSDTTEMLEGYAGILARKRGYDAIFGIDSAVPEFTEYVGLTERAFRK